MLFLDCEEHGVVSILLSQDITHVLFHTFFAVYFIYKYVFWNCINLSSWPKPSHFFLPRIRLSSFPNWSDEASSHGNLEWTDFYLRHPSSGPDATALIPLVHYSSRAAWMYPWDLTSSVFSVNALPLKQVQTLKYVCLDSQYLPIVSAY